MFHKTKKLDNIIIFHTNTAMRSRLSNQKFFILSMKINLPIFRVLVDRVKAAERQNLRSDIIFDSIDGFEVCNTLGTFSLKTVIFSDFPPILWLIFKRSRWRLFRVISISNSIFGGGNRIGFLNISVIINDVCVLCFGRNDDGLFTWWKSFFAKVWIWVLRKFLFSRGAFATIGCVSFGVFYCVTTSCFVAHSFVRATGTYTPVKPVACLQF